MGGFERFGETELDGHDWSSALGRTGWLDGVERFDIDLGEWVGEGNAPAAAADEAVVDEQVGYVDWVGAIAMVGRQEWRSDTW
ncbi:hypothetical protein V5P93_005860 [Actinokineospora auranticolor]|uniref:Uncharacterized protein n=1 Tax=Actinokineospora auranticolor TaxID=155976 RepID=A0A2S6GJN2_9PSEU|nr:hypothetical protein [Actinokineospora auranticolor]PPK65361.1 hypothetical protein CLV40_11413 [Actinokineospora auranticolor]